MDACVATVAVGWWRGWVDQRVFVDLFAMGSNVCTALHCTGGEKVWLSKPGGVAGALAMYYCILYSVAGMADVAVYLVQVYTACAGVGLVFVCIATYVCA